MANESTNSSARTTRDFKLNALLEVTKAINSNFSKEQLLKIYESILKNQLKLPRFAVYTVRPGRGVVQEISSGLSPEDLQAINIHDYLSKISDPLEVYELGESSFDWFDYIIPVFHKSQPLAYVLIGINDNISNDHLLDKEDLSFIQALTNIIYVAFENKNLAKEKIQQERLRKELELASEVQNMLLPHAFPKSHDILVDAFYKSHTEVGGDYYDFFQLNQDEYAICIADVSGKGVSAALLMSNFQANVRALFHYIPTLDELTRVLNRKVIENAKGERFITAFLAKYHARHRTLTYLNAGHLPPILISGNHQTLLREGSVGLGMLDEMPFVKTRELVFEPDTLLVCYTDGLTELQDDNNNFLGLDVLREMIHDNRMLNPEQLTVHVLIALEKFKGNQPYKDDIAFLACRFL